VTLDLDVTGFRMDPARRPPLVDLDFLSTKQRDDFRQGFHLHHEVNLSDCVRPSPDSPGWEDLVKRCKEDLREFSVLKEGERR